MWEKHKKFWTQKTFLASVLFGLLLLLAGFFANYYANSYITTHVSNNVTDILLDHLPTLDVHLIFSEGAVLFILVLVAILLAEPQYIPLALKNIAVFIMIRSFFIVLTHLAPPANEIYIDPADFISRVSSGDDLFFSAHTGLPFLMAFVFWNKPRLRYFFIACTIIGGVAVLLGHLHYSIDVFSALFISYGIFHICKKFFTRDYRLAKEA